MPRALSAGFVLPTTAVVALAVTATGVTAAPESTADAQPMAMTWKQADLARDQEVASETATTDIASRRQDATMQSAALQGRVEAQAKAARAAKRKAAAQAKADAAAAAARAEAERKAKLWVRPIGIWHITSGYGYRWGSHHDGIDLGAPTGTPLYAMSQGRVLSAGWEDSFGNKVAIQYWDGSISWYGHMSRIDVYPGQEVGPGTQVGLVGNTGHSFGSHLHFEMQASTAYDQSIDPVPWLQSHGLW